MPENYLFISYKSEENPFTLKLAASLKNRGVNVWVDRLDGGIETGDLWIKALDDALKGCGGMIAVITPDYFSSKVCMNELGFAYREERTLFPVLMRPTSRDLMPFWLPDYQWSDFTGWLDDAAYERQVDALVQHIENKQKRAIGAVPGAEIRYLNTLIAELESQQGVENYVALAGQSELVRVNPRMEKHVDPSLALLLPKPERNTEPPEYKPIADIHEAVKLHEKFVLIGDPGAGKTTTLRRMALETARARLEWINPPTPSPLHKENEKIPEIPLLVYLPRWSDELSAEEFINAQWQEQTGLSADVLRELHEGRIRMYIDGLNEMGGAEKNKAEKLRGWLNDQRISPKHAVISCRKDDFDGVLDLKLPTVLVEPLSDEKIREFINKYVEDEQKAFSFCDKVFPLTSKSWQERQRSLIHLARNPYFLVALLLIFEVGGDLPRNTGALFKQLVMVLWDRERRRKTFGWIPLNQMLESFGRLAFDMIDTNQPIDVQIDYALERLGSYELLEAGKSAGFVTIKSEQVRFSHQLILEFFAALGLSRTNLYAVIAMPKISRWGNRLPGKWDKIVVALCSAIEDSGEVINNIVKIDPYLAADCLISGAEVDNETRATVINALILSLRDKSTEVRHAAVETLERLSWTPSQLDEKTLYLIAKQNWQACIRLGESAVPMLLDALRINVSSVRIEIIRILGQIGGSHVIFGLLDVLQDRFSYVRIEAVEALGQMGDTRAVPGLLNALGNANYEVRHAIAKALRQIDGVYVVPDAVDVLNDASESNRITTPDLVDAVNNPSESDQMTAVKTFADIVDTSVVPGLLDALRGESIYVRSQSMNALKRKGVAAVPGLIEALHDENWDVRSASSEVLKGIGVAAVPGLIEALQDENIGVRIIVALTLGRIANKRAVNALIQRLSDTEKLYPQSIERVCDYAAEALEKIGTPEALVAVRKWREEQGRGDSE